VTADNLAADALSIQQ